MAEIYLRHPRHGVKIASMEMEAQHDEMHGWSRFDPAASADDAPLPDELENTMVEPRRRGRPRVTQDD